MSLIITRGYGDAGGDILSLPLTIDIDDNTYGIDLNDPNLLVEIDVNELDIELGE